MADQAVAIIPARGGSKRIPRKNVRLLSGRPLIAWSIQLCIDSGVFDDVIVSTEDDQIAEVALSCGASVPFVRPAYLADDHTATVDVIAHAIRSLAQSGRAFQEACCVYPASVFLSPGDFQRAHELLPLAPFVSTVTRYPHPTQRAMRMGADGALTMVHPEYANARTQDLAEHWHDAGQFYWGGSRAWLERLPILPNSVGYPVENRLVVDIDTEADWNRAEQLHRMLLDGANGSIESVG